MAIARSMILVILLAWAGVVLAGCASPHARTAEAFREARARGDLDAARGMMGRDPRIWYGSRDGPGAPWSLDGAGRWAGWDDHFNSHGTVGQWRVEGHTASAIVWEHNDYFRLCEAGPSPWTLTYFFDEQGRIEGMMVSPAPEGVEGDRGRRDEFDAWLRATHPEEHAYLRPGGDIDPTGDRPERTRRMLHAWRRELGLAPEP